MSKKLIISIVAIILLAGSGIGLYFWLWEGSQVTEKTTTSKCQTTEMIFYYSNGCGWCTKVKNDGSIQKLEALGVKVKQVEVSVGPIEHKFTGVPTFVVNNQVNSGYKTYDQLKQLLGCTE